MSKCCINVAFFALFNIVSASIIPVFIIIYVRWKYWHWKEDTDSKLNINVPTGAKRGRTGEFEVDEEEAAVQEEEPLGS